jgi:diguanylate cyclase (GGDEF)-like protein
MQIIVEVTNILEVANRLNASVREEDLISRLGGDEFIIVIEETKKEEVAMIANRLLENKISQLLTIF